MQSHPFLAESGKDCVHLTFDFANFSLPDLQFDRLQLIIHALDLDGQIIKDVFVNSTLCNVSGLPIEKNLTSKSYLQYYLFSLKDQLKLHLEVNLPQHVCKYVQLRLLFYSATSDGRPIGNMPIALAFMRLLNNNALIGIGSAEIIIYKVDSTAMITEQKYLRASATKKKLRSHASENEMIALTTIPLYIATLSSNFTPDQNVLALLKCKEKVVVQDAMQKLASISSDFSLFVPRILLKLFDKLSMQDNELNRAIFGFINVLFKRSEYPMEYNLKKVVDSELVSLNNPRVYEPFFNLLNSSIVPDNLSDDVKTVFWMDTVRGSPKMAKIIIMSASSDPQLINYKQGNSINNFVSQHLNTKFTLLLNNIISTLRSKNTQLADHQWMICKNLPDMIDVLFQHEIFDAHALALFLIELVQIVPAKYQNSQIELIRAVTKTQLYKDENVRRSTLMPAIMPFIVQSLDVASTRPIESSKLLHSTVALLLNILHLIRSPLHQIGDKSTREELLFVTTNCLLPIIRCFNASIYNGHGELELLSQTVFVTLIDLIDAQMFSAYLETFEDEHSISDMLAEFLKSLRAFTEPTSIQEFNEQPVKLVLQQQCVKYFQVIYSFLMSSNENRLNLYFEQINSLRLASVECFRSMWFSLSANKKLALGRNTFEFVLDLLSSVQSQRLNSILLAMFGDILKTEGYHYIELTKQNSDRCFTVYKLLHNKLMKRPTSLKSRNTLCTELEKELHSFVLCDQKFSCVKKLNMLPTFLKLINYGREALFRNNPFEIGLIYYKFLEFWYEIGEKELILEYILRLYTFHKNQDELVEAALSLQNYALRLSWTNNEDAPELRPLTKSLKLEVKSERQIKEHLYWHVSELFGMASAWELAIPILKELATHYETVNLDYEQLGNVMEKLKECYHLIGKRLRLNCLYFVVSFYGSQQPDYLRNKRFIFCGKPVEMLDSFRQRIVLNFGCELRHSLDEDPEKLFALDGRHATVASVQPVPGNQYLRLSVAENPLVAWYYKHNVMNKFLMTRPLNKKKSEWTEKFGVTDTTKVWIKCTEFNLNQTLPGILSFREVFLERELETLNPLQAACLTLTNTNEELSINARLVSQGFGDTYLNALLGQLRGILQAFVGGGIANYEMFLSDQVDSLLVEKEMLGEKERLKNLLVEQVKLLDYGLYVNAEHLNEATKLLHDTLVDSFNEYKQKIQKLCGVEFIASLSRKASMSELDSHRRNTKYLSRLSTDGTSFTGDLKPALQQRSMSITCPADSSIHQKPSVLKRKLIKSDLPLPSRRSNRHSTKLLNP
ncbi:hypothetical protein M3Y97_00402500 [Aphelenchoides bicaudatus]|nr:hypothetical protein M3Y97_00402500 [Aphelenchoides bicaudatus]